ncbi:hypothetical protein APHAL10511_007648 [Amanita phalloides]|nr:hypothetical protein APHAL10511_007648 [Amanita phalloides]
MQTRKTVTIVTSPASTASSLPLSPTTSSKRGVQYRIEERTRTVYVTSDDDPTKWDQQSITNILRVTEVSDADQSDSSHSRLSIKRSSSQPLEPPSPADTTKSSASSPESRTTNKSQRRETRIGTTLQIPSPHSAPSVSPIRLSSQRSYERPKVLFYHKEDPYYGFTNFSPHPVIYKGKKYPTSEHLFQSFKFHDYRPGLAEHIRTCSERPSVAFSEARRFQPEVRPNWLDINIQKMEEVLWHKFTQHSDLKAELLSTGNAELIEASDKDAFWGWGADRRGRNELGKALERLRARLRDA